MNKQREPGLVDLVEVAQLCTRLELPLERDLRRVGLDIALEVDGLPKRDTERQPSMETMMWFVSENDSVFKCLAIHFEDNFNIVRMYYKRK